MEPTRGLSAGVKRLALALALLVVWGAWPWISVIIP
jgi:hypothetical protein